MSAIMFGSQAKSSGNWILIVLALFLLCYSSVGLVNLVLLDVCHLFNHLNGKLEECSKGDDLNLEPGSATGEIKVAHLQL